MLTRPVSITAKLISLLPEPKNLQCPLIRRIVKAESGDHFHESIGVSHTTILGEFKKPFCPFVVQLFL